MVKYHISPTTGNPNRCYAERRPCPLGAATEHYASKEEARAGFEKASMATNLVAHRKPGKRSVTKCGLQGEHNLYAHQQGSEPKAGEHFDLGRLSEREANEILDWWERPWRTEEASYSPEERKIAMAYQWSLYRELGAAQRGQAPWTPELKEQAKVLLQGVKKAKLAKPLTLFRGVTSEHKALQTLKPGDSFEELSVASTSPSEHEALTFAGKAEGYMLQIEAPAGTPAWDVGASLDSVDEDEVLLPPHRLVVTKVQDELLDGVALRRISCRYEST